MNQVSLAQVNQQGSIGWGGGQAAGLRTAHIIFSTAREAKEEERRGADLFSE